MAVSQYIAFKEGVVWNITTDEDTAKDWLDRGVVECYGRYDPVGPLIGAEE